LLLLLVGAVCANAATEAAHSEEATLDHMPHHATDHGASRAELSGAYSSCESDPRTVFQRALKEAMLQDAGAQKLPEQHLQRRLTASMVNQLQIMSASTRGGQALSHRCDDDVFKRAVSRYDARHLVALAKLKGAQGLVESNQVLKNYRNDFECARKMYNAVVPLWHSKAKIEEAQGYSERSFCEQFRMQWTQRHMVQKAALEAAKTPTITGVKVCSAAMVEEELGKSYRAQYMVNGIKENCKGYIEHEASMEGRVERATVRHKVAAYVVNSIMSDGRERYQDSLSTQQKFLFDDDLMQDAKHYLKESEKQLSESKNGF